MTPHLDQLQHDHAAITGILAAQRALPVDGKQVGVRILLGIYFHILEDALTTLNSLIQYMHSRNTGENDLPNPTRLTQPDTTQLM